MIIINKNNDIFNFDKFIKIYTDGNALFAMVNAKESILIDCFQNEEIAKDYKKQISDAYYARKKVFEM